MAEYTGDNETNKLLSVDKIMRCSGDKGNMFLFGNVFQTEFLCILLLGFVYLAWMYAQQEIKLCKFAAHALRRVFVFLEQTCDLDEWRHLRRHIDE